MMEPWRDIAVAEAQRHLGTPYQPRGNVPGLALDCGTLLWHVYSKLIPLPRFPADYPADWAMHNEDNRYLDWIAPFVKEVRRPIRGGITVYKYGRSFSHGAVRLDRKNVIHAWGRAEFGRVQRTHDNFFCLPNGAPRERLHFDLKPELVA